MIRIVVLLMPWMMPNLLLELTRRFCETGAKKLGYGSFKEFLEENYDENCIQTFRRLTI